MNYAKRILAAFLTLMMCVGMLPTTVFAAEYYPDCTGKATCTAEKHNATCRSLAYKPQEPEAEKCAECGMELKFGACTNPECVVNAPTEPEAEKCAECGMELKFGACTNPECVVNAPTEPEAEKCAECGMELKFGACTNPECPLCPNYEPAEPVDCKHVRLEELSEEAATCESTGIAAGFYTCKDCGAVVKGTHTAAEGSWIISALGHNYENGVCTRCGEKEPVVVCNHAGKITYPATEATCTTDGNQAYWYCPSCEKYFQGTGTNNKQVNVADMVIPAEGHDYQYIQGATGTGGAGHAQECTVCGVTTTFVPHTGTWEETEATCTSDGVRTRTCTECGAEETQVIPATGHKDVDNNLICDDCGAVLSCDHNFAATAQNTYPATCTTAGYTVKRCIKCNTYEVEINRDQPALGHDYHADPSSTTATCEQSGETTLVCERCGKTETVTELPLGHLYTEDSIYVPLGDAHVKQCAREGCTEVARTSALPHEVEEWTQTVAPQVGIPGLEEGTCTVCHQTFGRPVEALPAPGGSDDTEIPPSQIPTGSGSSQDGSAAQTEVEVDELRIPLAGLMSRAEFVSFLWEFEGRPNAVGTTFADVPEGHEYYTAVSWAQANGIAFGVDDTPNFEPDELVLEGHARLFLERYAALKQIPMPELITLLGLDDMILANPGEVLEEFRGYLPKDNDDAE